MGTESRATCVTAGEALPGGQGNSFPCCSGSGCHSGVSLGSSPLLVYQMACTPASLAEVVDLACEEAGGLWREFGRFAVDCNSRRYHEALGNDASARHDIWQPRDLGRIVPPMRRELQHLLGGRKLARIFLALLAAAWYKYWVATARSHLWNPELGIFTHETWVMGLRVDARQR